MIEHSYFHYHLIDRVDLDIQQLGDLVLVGNSTYTHAHIGMHRDIGHIKVYEPGTVCSVPPWGW